MTQDVAVAARGWPMRLVESVFSAVVVLLVFADGPVVVGAGMWTIVRAIVELVTS